MSRSGAQNIFYAQMTAGISRARVHILDLRVDDRWRWHEAGPGNVGGGLDARVSSQLYCARPERRHVAATIPVNDDVAGGPSRNDRDSREGDCDATTTARQPPQSIRSTNTTTPNVVVPRNRIAPRATVSNYLLFAQTDFLLTNCVVVTGA